MQATLRILQKYRPVIPYKELQKQRKLLNEIKFQERTCSPCSQILGRRIGAWWSVSILQCGRHPISSSSNIYYDNFWGCACYYHCQTPNQNSRKSVMNAFVEKAPYFIQPYLKLMRIDKPIGTWLLLWPCYWSIGLAAESSHLPSIYHILLFGLGAILMRGAGCTINDMWDKEFDKKVQRTKFRPLSSGEIERSDALGFLALELSLAVLVLLQLNWYSIVLGSCAIVPVVFYPLAKRFTYWPQFVLGLTFNWGAILGWISIHGSCYWPVVFPLYLAGISWTMIYDTIYAHQDKVDDSSIGIKSTALKFGSNTKKWLSLFSTSMIGNLLIVGVASGQTLPYYASVVFVGAHIFRQLWKLDINDRKDCFKKFQSNTNVGFLLFAGIVCGTLFKQI